MGELPERDWTKLNHWVSEGARSDGFTISEIGHGMFAIYDKDGDTLTEECPFCDGPLHSLEVARAVCDYLHPPPSEEF
jgi:hypothetical protein